MDGIYIDDERLEDFGVSTARLLRPGAFVSASEAVQALRTSLAQIDRSYEAVRRRWEKQASIPAACEWLLDNRYLARREGLSALPALRHARRLRGCGDGVWVLALCRALVEAGEGQVTEERCTRFLRGVQSVTVLSRAELALLLPCLRTALLEQVASVCRQLRYAADTEPLTAALEALFGSLRLFSVLDAEELLRAADRIGAVLADDPSGDYAHMDRQTQEDYLRRVELLARREGVDEIVYARRLVKRAAEEGRHVGFYLFRDPSPLREALYIAANVLLTLFFSLLPAFSLQRPAAALLLLLPVSELVKNLIDDLLLHLIPPRRLPRMDLRRGVPVEGRTLCVLTAMPASGDEAEALARKLEELRLASRSEGENLRFGLLADLPPCEQATGPDDGAILRRAEAAIEDLNRRCGGGFYLFTRPRSFDGESWCGRERKRGALLDLARLLNGEESPLVVSGDRDALNGTRFLISLDSDTQLYPGAAGELIGAMLHPLNRPVLDEQRGLVVRGCGLIHPRIDTELSSASASDFSLIFAPGRGSDPYGSLCSELYMDAFGNGGFVGKGILDLRCLLACSARLPEKRILSHDALEGAFLRGAYCGDLAFSDRFPVRPLSYFKRLHRWTRGDWQNLPWIFHRALRPLDRWRLFDNLRRSLVAPMTLLALLAGFFLPESLSLAAWAALLALLSRLFLSFAEEQGRSRAARPARRFTRLLTGVGGSIVQSFLRLWLLPCEAWVSLSAIGLSLWRMLISHRRLLQWQTAAQAEQRPDAFSAYAKALWQSLLLGLLLMLFSPTIIGKATGLSWFFAPLLAYALALPAYAEPRLSAAEQDYLRSAAGEALQYYRDTMTARDNYLPPDNFQEQPPVGLAHRSSPTNMGLALLALAGGVEMGLLEQAEALALIARSLDTLEKLPRHRGHFFNWYDTQSLQPLTPPYLSTVDSGNLYAALLTLEETLKAWGETALAERVNRLLEPMDFSLFFDRSRRLFTICYDPAEGRGRGGWYDLMASEAMLTSYLAIAKGDVPRRHWARLGRGQLQKDGYRGLASWTGTMFEYRMPELFLPFERGSLLYESSRFCLYVQKHRVSAGRPWGVSESAFYSLDPGLSYRYKANGCAALALKRGQDGDLVVSPYSSFLMLGLDPVGSLRNLHRLERFGARGRYGFMEALDFTPSRCRAADGEKVRCYMAHHIGMSVIAAANALCGNILQKRFMAVPAMASHRLLLQERVLDGPVMSRDRSERPEQSLSREDPRWQLRGSGAAEPPHPCLLSNGAYHLLADQNGYSRAIARDCQLYGLPDSRECGFQLSLSVGEEQLPVFPNLRPRLWQLGEEQLVLGGSGAGLDWEWELAAATGDWGERRILTLYSAEERRFRLRLRFRPLLARPEAQRSHPAYWRLGLEAEALDSGVLLHRLPRDDQEPLWLCLCADRPLACACDLRLPLVRLETELHLAPGESLTLILALCLAETREDALSGAQRILHSRERGNMVSAAATRLGLSAEEVGAAMALLPTLSVPLSGAAPRRELWPCGISGDYPLLCCEARAIEALPLLRRWLLLKSCGVESDLVYLSDEQGEYHRPAARRIGEELARQGLEPLLGSRAGVHIAPLKASEAVASRAAYLVGRGGPTSSPLSIPLLSRPRRDAPLPGFGWTSEGFAFSVKDSLPPRAWQLPLSFGRLGALVCDVGVAALWQENAREMRLMPPMEDIRGVQPGCALWAQLGERSVSLFAANDGLPCTLRFAPGRAVWEKQIGERSVRTTAFLDPESDLLVLLLEGAEGLYLRFALQPLLGPDSSSLQAREHRGLAVFENPESYLPGVSLIVGTDAEAGIRLSYRPPALLLSFQAADSQVIALGCGGEDRLRALLSPERARAGLEALQRFWSERLKRVSFPCPSEAFSHYVNHWAVYQTLACRLWARSSLYQSGGAYGFRDQLQDAVNLLPLDAGLARSRIEDACRHQYVEGDVMHWWHPHPDGDKGVRSRCSDDLLWLVWALCEYVEQSRDSLFCLSSLPYRSSPPLREDERDRYELPELSENRSPILDHARAALDRCLSRGFGPHGLPWFGSGDWNDGLSAVGGESVWLGWFLSHCCERFAALLDFLQMPGGRRYRESAEAVGRAADAAWNGRWYERGYTADGAPLGGPERIDSLPQAWAAFSSYASPERVDRALDAAKERLADPKTRLIKLFDPPYTEAEPYPGYLVGYGAGFRENGGQYTHAAVWLARAFAKRGRKAEAWELLGWLLPENRDSQRYEAEPFVLPADVSTAPGREGEAGWTWYTGSAGWFWRTVRELSEEN